MDAVEFFAPHMALGLDLNSERNLPFGAISDGASARYIKKGGIHTGPGYRRIIDLETDLPVDDLFGSKHQVLKSLWAKSGTKLFHTCQTEDGGFDIGAAFTSTERLAIVEQGNGDLFLYNQTDTPKRLAVARLEVAFMTMGDGIEVGAAYIDKFDGNGDVYINGVKFTYASKSGTKLETITVGPIPSGGFPIGTLVTQFSEPASMVDLAGNAVKGYCGMEIEGSQIVAGVKGTEDILRISAPSTLDDEQFFYDFQSNGADAKIMSNPVTAMIRGTDRGYIFGESYVKGVLGFNVATGILEMYDITPDFGAYNPRCVVDMGGRVLFFGKKRLMPVTLVSQPQNDGQESRVDPNFDQAIQPWLQSIDDDQFEHALVEYDQPSNLVSITAKVNGSLQTYIMDNSEGVKAFAPRETRPMRCHAFFDGASYFGNNSTSLIYKNHTGLTNDGVAIAHRWTTGRMEKKKGIQEVLADMLKTDGFMTQGCEFTINIYLDGSTEPAYTQDFDDSIISSNMGRPIGTRGCGSNQVGGNTDTPVLAYPYKLEIGDLGLSADDYKIEWLCSKEGAFLQTNNFLMTGKGVRFSSRDRR